MATTHSGRSSSMRPSTSMFARAGAYVLLISTLLLLTGRTISEALAADPSFVTRDGSQLMLDGRPFRFTGINIYGANSDGWCGEDYTADQLRTAFDGIGSRDTVLRSWFFQPLAAAKGPDGAWTGLRDWTRFDQTLAVAREKGIHVIVTLTDQWGECGDGGDSGFKTKAWYLGGYNAPDPILAAKYDQWLSYRAWVVEIVTRYKDDPTILAWQLINEGEVKDSLNAGCPTGDPDDPMDHGNILRDFAQDISGMIRGIDPNHLISLGTLGGGQCGTQDWQYSLVHALPNIDMCEYHDYLHEVMPGDQWNGLQVRIDQCAALDKPIFVGESGITPDTIPGGTFEDRAELYDAKFRAQFAAGVQGEVAWAYRRTGSTLQTFDIGDGDPTLLRLQAWSTGCDPNDYRIAYTKEPPGGGAGSPDLYLLDPITGAQRRVTVDVDHGERQVAWSADGQRLAYLSNGGSFVSRTDLRAVNVDGSSVTHLTGSNEAPAFQPAWSPDGTRIAFADSLDGSMRIAVMNADGTGRVLLDPGVPLGAESSPTWSPDGSLLAYVSSWNGSGVIKTIRSDGTDPNILTSAPGIRDVTWSPDGSRLAFTKDEFNNGYWRAEIYVMNADGTGQVKLTGALSNETFYQFSRPAWSGDDRLLFSSGDLNGRSDIYEMNADGTGLVNLTNTPGVDETDPAWRPARVPPVICSPEPPPPTAPAQPLNVTAVAAGPGSATVTWDPPASDGGAELLDYRIYADGTSVGGVPANLTSETIQGLAGGTYTFTVRTQNIIGESELSAPSNPVTIAPPNTPPGAPTNVTAAAGDGTASVTWLAPSSDGGSPITGYTVTTSVGPPPSPGPGGTPGPGPSGLPGGPATTATVAGLTNGTTYTFTVRATNDIGTGPGSSSAAVTPQAGAPDPQATTVTIPTAGGTATTDPLATGPSPANPITTSVIVPATSGGGSVTIAETAIGAAPAGYVFFGQQVEIVSTAATTASNPVVIVFGIDPMFVPADIFRDGVLVNAPCNPIGTATPSPCIAGGAGTAQVTVLTAEASQWNFGLATSPPGPPTNVAATRGDRQASVTWEAPAFNGGSAITSYTVTSTPGGKTAAVSGSTTSAIVSGLSNGTTYTFKVVAANAIGSGPPSAPSNAVIPAPKTNQAITFAAISNKILTQSPVTVSPTASSGLPVTLTTTTLSACTVSGTTITFVATGSCTIVASQAGDAVYKAAPIVTRTFTISKAPQTITFVNPGAMTMIQSPQTVSATTTSPLTVTLTSTTLSACTVSGTTITFVANGSCTIVASQAGDAVYKAAPIVTRTFTISKAPQTITFVNPGAMTMIQSPQTVSATTTSPLTVTLTSTTLSACTVSGTTITFVANGSCTIVASQAGDAVYKAAPIVTRTFTISKAPQTITFVNPGPQSMVVPMVLVSPTASSGLSVTLTSSTKAVCTVSSTTITLLKPGTCKITAAQAGNAVYKAAAPVLQTFTITLAAPLSLVVANGTGMSGPNR